MSRGIIDEPAENDLNGRDKRKDDEDADNTIDD